MNTMLKAARQINIDYHHLHPNETELDICIKLEENPNLRRRYRQQIMDASCEPQFGKPLPNHACGPWGRNPLKDAILRGENLIAEGSPDYGAPAKEVFDWWWAFRGLILLSLILLLNAWLQSWRCS